jgi:RNA 3'-terminal phosphate cyclase (ATP)
MLTGKPVTIDNMRARRDRTGLMRQHLTAVKAATEISCAEVSGAGIGSSRLDFRPGRVKAGQYQFDVGSAGSTTLVLQTVLPPLLLADARSELVLEGGTHNPGAPIFEFLQKAYLPLINRMGPHVEVHLERHGFYPAGGGRLVVTIEPLPVLRGFHLLERGAIIDKKVVAIIANLAGHIASREVGRILESLEWEAFSGSERRVDAHGPGNAVWAEIHSEHITELFQSFGRLGVPAEAVADEVVVQAQNYLTCGAPVGPYLADQLLLPLGISAWQSGSSAAADGSSFLTCPLTEHSNTHMEIVRQFLGIHIFTHSSNHSSTCIVSLKAAEN